MQMTHQRNFDKLGREFDNREYSKALRTADTILSTTPDDADTIAMKGLTLHYLERKDEAYELVKTAITLQPSSTIAWHSLGMCQRQDKNFAEAFKAFKRAWATSPNNVNILRDLSSVCVQLRDWEQFVEFREKMVTIKSTIRANWIALSCGHRMLGHTKLAAAVMDVLTSIMDAGDTMAERSELHLYRVELELEHHSGQRALELLRQHDADIVDNQTKLQLRARAHVLLGQKGEAEKRYMELLRLGVAEADCIAALAQLRKIALDDSRRPRTEVTRYMEMLNAVLQACPRSEYAQRHLLDCVPVGQLRPHLERFAGRYIRRLIPSLFAVLKSLYGDADRVAVVEEVFLSWQAQLEAGACPAVLLDEGSVMVAAEASSESEHARKSSYGVVNGTHARSCATSRRPPSENSDAATGGHAETTDRVADTNKRGDGAAKPSHTDDACRHPSGARINPCYLLWVYTYLASHYRRIGNYSRAHGYIDRAIEHTPTLELLYLEKARIHRREGDTAAAARLADAARKLDLQDKYLNSKAAKYYFHDNQIEAGEALMHMFYSPSVVPGDTYLTALESQCLWYEREVGDAYYRMGDYLSALHYYRMFELHHAHNHADLCEFHNYVFRRNTMRAWFNVLRCDSDVTRNRFWLPFAHGLVRTYLAIHAHGESAVRAAHVPRPTLNLAGLASEDAKRLSTQVKTFALVADEVDLSAPLEKAQQYVDLLLTHRPTDPLTHTLAVEYFSACEKPVLVARSLYSLHRMGEAAEVQRRVESFRSDLYARMTGAMDTRVRAVVDEVLQLIKS